MTNHKCTLKNLPQVLFCHVYYHQKAKYYRHITIQQLDWACGKMRNLPESPTLQKGIIGKRMLKSKAARKGRPKNDGKDSTLIQT